LIASSVISAVSFCKTIRLGNAFIVLVFLYSWINDFEFSQRYSNGGKSKHLIHSAKSAAVFRNESDEHT